MGNAGISAATGITIILLVGSCMNTDKTSSTKPIEIRCMTYNILEGGIARGSLDWENGYFTSTEDRIPLLIELITDTKPEIVFLQECNGWADNDNEILNKVAATVGMNGVIAPNNGPYLVAILSKFPITSFSHQPGDSIYRWNLLVADLSLPNGRALKVASTHFGWWGYPRWWEDGTTKEEKLQMYLPQTEFLMAQLDKYKDVPFIIAGDWNHPDEFHSCQEGDTGEHVDIPCEIIRNFYPQIRAKGFTDIYLALNNTYKGKRTSMGFESGVIDHIFASPPIAANFKNCKIIQTPLTYQTSDHLPIQADLELP